MTSKNQLKNFSPLTYGLSFGVLCGALSSLPIGLIPSEYLSTGARLLAMFGICLLSGIVGGVRFHFGLIR